MPALTLSFDRHNRPLVHVKGRPDVVTQQQQFLSRPPRVVPSFDLLFLVDTGAIGCVVEEHVIAGWGLMKSMPVLVNDPVTGKAKVKGYRFPLKLELHGSQPRTPVWRHDVWPVATVDDGRFDDQGFKGIIGMDMLRLASLTYTGGSVNRCELSWP